LRREINERWYVPPLRRALCLLIVPLFAAACGGGERQDANEPEGDFRVEVVRASFPKRQHIAEDVSLRLRVRNLADRTLDNVAVTVETKANGANAPAAFGQRASGTGLADSERPVWVLEEGPVGGGTAYDNTWLAGTLAPGEAREMIWKLVASKAGSYEVGYSVAPGLTGRGQAVGRRTDGSFDVTISDAPVPARVDEDGKVVRGEGLGDGVDD
jgi:hypothetical protein